MVQHMGRESTSALCLVFHLDTLVTMEVPSQRFVYHSCHVLLIYNLHDSVAVCLVQHTLIKS